MGIEDYYTAITTLSVGIRYRQFNRYPTVRQKGVHAIERDPFQMQGLWQARLRLSIERPIQERNDAGAYRRQNASAEEIPIRHELHRRVASLSHSVGRLRATVLGQIAKYRITRAQESQSFREIQILGGCQFKSESEFPPTYFCRLR
jgi:hypothetical protein